MGINPEYVADQAAQQSLRLAGADPAGWVPPAPDTGHDVAVVGAGQSGLTIAYALRRAGITRVTVLDAGNGDDVGSWAAQARMLTLRTGKTIPGPELGNPALGFRAWYEARHGLAGWDAIGRIATEDWIAYLGWYRRQVAVPVRYGVRLERIEPVEDGRLRLHLESGEVETVRKVVLATGVRGTGGPYVPAVVAALPRNRYAHTGHVIDFGALAGRVVAVLGSGSSAFDAAATALEAGAREVHLFSRRADPVIAGPGGNPVGAAVLETFHLLPDAERWRRRRAYSGSVPLDSVQRAAAYPGFHLHLAADWLDARDEGDHVRVTAADGVHDVDFVIAGTGYQQDPATRPELAGIADRIALWRDRYEPPEDLRADQLGAYPYLGAGYQLTARQAGDAVWAGNIHAFNVGASQSFGRPVGDVPSLRAGVPRLVDAIALDLVRSSPPPPPPAGPTSYQESYAHNVWRVRDPLRS